MKSHALRFYVVSVTLLVFFVLWAVVAAKPWAAKAASRPQLDPRLAALNRRERHLRHEAAVVNRTLARRWSAYRRQLKAREARIRALQAAHARQVAAAQAAAARSAAASVTYAAAPATSAASGSGTRVVTLPPKVTVVTLPPATPAATSSGSSHP